MRKTRYEKDGGEVVGAADAGRTEVVRSQKIGRGKVRGEIVGDARADRLESVRIQRAGSEEASGGATDAGRPETVRVRMTVDLVGPLAEELEKTATQLGKTKTDVVRDGLGYVFRALKARNDGYFVGAWKEEPDGKISRSREFEIGN